MSSHVRHTITFSSLTLLSRITGLLRMMAITATLGGLSRLNDSFQLAYNIPYMIYEFIMGGLLSAIFIPLLVRQQEKTGKDSPEAWRVANLLVGYVGIVLAAISVLAIVFSPQVIGLMTVMEHRTKGAADPRLATFFLRFFAPQMLFFGLNAVFMAISNSRGAFAASAAAPIINNLIAIASLIAFHFRLVSESGLALGTTCGVAAMAAVQFVAAMRGGMPVRPRANFRDPLFRSVAGLGLPIIAMSIANIVGTIIRANLLWTVPGGFSTYTISFQLIMTPYGIFAVSLATVLYPTLSRHAASADAGQFRSTFSLGIRWTTLVMLPVSVALSVLAQPITRVLFERGDFTYNHSLFMADFLRLYALSIFPYSLLIFATRAFYARKDTVTPAMINVGGVVLNAALNIVLMKVMGLSGIALAAGITHTCSFLASLFLLRRKTSAVGTRSMVLPVARMAGATAIMAIVLVAGLGLTERRIDVLERGRRFAAQLPPSAASGNALLIRNADSWNRFWSILDRKGSAVPTFDFTNDSIVVAFGPQSTAPTLLQLRDVEFPSTTTARLMLEVHGQPTSTTFAVDMPTSPAFLMALIRRPLNNIQPEFHISGKAVPSSFRRLLQAPDALRLGLLMVLGAVAFTLAAFALRTAELHSLMETITARLRRRRADEDTRQP